MIKPTKKVPPPKFIFILLCFTLVFPFSISSVACDKIRINSLLSSIYRYYASVSNSCQFDMLIKSRTQVYYCSEMFCYGEAPTLAGHCNALLRNTLYLVYHPVYGEAEMEMFKRKIRAKLTTESTNFDFCKERSIAMLFRELSPKTCKYKIRMENINPMINSMCSTRFSLQHYFVDANTVKIS